MDIFFFLIKKKKKRNLKSKERLKNKIQIQRMKEFSKGKRFTFKLVWRILYPTLQQVTVKKTIQLSNPTGDGEKNHSHIFLVI